MNKEITNVELAFADQNIDIATLDSMFEQVPEKFRKHLKDDFVLQVVTAAINGDSVPDVANTNVARHYPWWSIDNKDGGVSGRGLSLFIVVYDYSITYVGPRHLFAEEEGAEHAAEYFLPQYEAYHLGYKE